MNNEVIIKSQIRLFFDNGLDEKGQVKEVSRTINNVDVLATAEKIKAFASAYASLTTLAYIKVNRVNELEII